MTFLFCVLGAVIGVISSMLLLFVDNNRKFVAVSIPLTIACFVILILIPMTEPTIQIQETEVVAVNNVGYCEKRVDGTLIPIQKPIIESNVRDEAVLITKIYNHKLLCFEYETSVQYLEIPSHPNKS